MSGAEALAVSRRLIRSVVLVIELTFRVCLVALMADARGEV